MYTAVLGCGSVLAYELRSFVPTEGERVPCRSHGFCVVVGRGGVQGTRSGHPVLARARPRKQHELLEWLQKCPVTTIPALRRERFTLRLICDAEQNGLVAVDVRTGTVALAAH